MTKLIVIGFDAPVPQRVYELAAKGELPNILKLIRNGVYCENCLVPYPTITPPNWTTIVTGAWPGTHGITDFHLHKPGMPLNQTYQAFDSRDCLSEYIWETAEKVGRKSIILNWPSSWPPRIKEGYHIGGAGLALNEWRMATPGYGIHVCLANGQIYSTEIDPLFSPIEFEENIDWCSKYGCRRVARIDLKYSGSKYEIKSPKSLYLGIRGKHIYLFDENREKLLAEIDEGGWTNNILMDFDTSDGLRKGGFRIKALKVSEDSLKLFFTPIASLDVRDLPAYPENIFNGIDFEKMNGLPIPSHSIYRMFGMELIDVDTWLEAIDIEHQWLAFIASYLMKNKDWDLFFMHAHCPDWSYHQFMRKLYEASKSTDPVLKEYVRAEIGFYKSLDRMVGKIINSCSEESLKIIVSDHGAKSSEYKRPSIFKILADNGLASYKVDPDTGRIIEVDWSKTYAWPQRAVYIYVNLKGRDPNGIVDPKDYDKIRDKIIDALYSYIDPETGKRPILFAIKKEDARILGLYGDRIGDIIYALNPEFKGEHGTFLPTAEYGVGSLRGLLIFSGPNIKKNFILKRNAWLTDIVPTICYLLDIPIPRDAEGGILYQILEDPNLKLSELNKLRSAVNKLKNALEKERYLTHEYH